MILVHVDLNEANEFIAKYHRHHKPVVGHRFSIGAKKNDNLVGVAIIGRPVSRELDQKNILEITRLCTDGTKNACSFLYAGAARAGRSLGYLKIQTYILETESGISLIAADFQKEHVTSGGNWNHSKARSGKRRTDQPMGRKHRYAKLLRIEHEVT